MESDLPALMKLKPYADEKVWGGSLLKKIKNISSGSPVGETLEISSLKGMSSSFEGQGLETLVGELNYIVKLIETTDNLSVQVHPNDSYAARVEKSKGKSECWLILESEPGAGIYLGFKPGVSKESFEKMILEGEQVNDCLMFHKVKRGDFFFVPAGTIHAIGKGVVLVEVQQNCGVTYRVWDWNRLGLDGKPRQLHLKKALDVIEFDAKKNIKSFFDFKSSCLTEVGVRVLFDHPDFNFSIHKDQSILKHDSRGPNGVINLDKDSVKIQRVDQTVELNRFESAILNTSILEDTKILSPKSILGYIY